MNHIRRILCAMDFSGNPDDGSQRYLGVAMGTEENFDATIKRLNLEQMSHAQLKSTEMRKILASQLRFNGVENMGLCADVDRNRIIGELIEYCRHARRHKNVGSKRINLVYNYVLFSLIRDPITEFAAKHGLDLTDLVFQTDSDCVRFVRSNGVRCTMPQHTHSISDFIAWSNNYGIEPDGVISLDLKDEIRRLVRGLLKID